MIKFLFQGDSITDVGRNRDCNTSYGEGYPNLIAADFLKNKKGQFEFINKGISGNRVVDLYARIKCDFINLNPDAVSILIGVNDVWHELGGKNGVSAEKYETIYSMLIEDLKNANPDIKIFVLEPFVLKGPATENDWDYFSSEVSRRAAAAKSVADKYGLVFIPLQEKLNSASADGDYTYWLSDGVHPTVAGHQLIKDELSAAIVKAFNL